MFSLRGIRMPSSSSLFDLVYLLNERREQVMGCLFRSRDWACMGGQDLTLHDFCDVMYRNKLHHNSLSREAGDGCCWDGLCYVPWHCCSLGKKWLSCVLTQRKEESNCCLLSSWSSLSSFSLLSSSTLVFYPKCKWQKYCDMRDLSCLGTEHHVSGLESRQSNWGKRFFCQLMYSD